MPVSEYVWLYVCLYLCLSLCPTVYTLVSEYVWLYVCLYLCVFNVSLRKTDGDKILHFLHCQTHVIAKWHSTALYIYIYIYIYVTYVTLWLAVDSAYPGRELRRPSDQGRVWLKGIRPTSDHMGLHLIASDLNWAPRPKNHRTGPIEIHSNLKDVCVLITQTHSQPPCDCHLTDPRIEQFFWKTGSNL